MGVFSMYDELLWMTDADEEAFEDNAEEYMRRDVEGSGTHCNVSLV